MYTRRELLNLIGVAAVSGAMPACAREEPAAPEPVAAAKPEKPVHEPGPSGGLHYRSIRDVARLIESREISPLELTRMMLERIEALDGRLHSYATVTADRALAAARQAEQEIFGGNYRGPLHGVPVAVKDLCYTQGTRTMGGLAVKRDFVPEYDATVVARLEAAGAVLLGKLNLTEGAMAGYHPDFDIPVNPWKSELWPGASSSGSGVATAAGLCFAALGSDTGGSIRFPAMANGIVGLKPTYGRVSRHGVLPLAPSMDHVGPMTRRVADSAYVLQAIAGHDPADPTSLQEPVPTMIERVNPGVAGLRIGFDREFATQGIDPGLVAAIDQALEILQKIGAQIVEVKMPDGSRDVQQPWSAICAHEALQAHADSFPERAADYGAFFRGFLESGAAVTPEQLAAARQFRAAFSQQFNELLESVDAMVCPAGGLTFALDPEVQYGGAEELEPLFESVQMHFTIPADFAGTPALTMPCGFAESGLPYALQFMGPRLSEPMLVRIGHAYEAATSWHQRHPGV
jgi:amidase